MKKYKMRLFPPLKGSPPRHPAHAGYAVLTLLATIAALWQHGDPRYTLSVSILAFFCSFSLLIPYRFCNNLMRAVFKILLFGAGCFWCMHRLNAGTPLDKMLVETLALWNLTFLVGGHSKEYFYLLFIDLLLLLYAALIPRLLSLYMTIGALLIVIFILFANRSGYLSGDMLIATPRGRIKRNWFHYTIYLLIAAALFHYLFIQMPLMPETQEGLIPVSFTTDKESFAPPDVKKWLSEGLNKKNGPDGKDSDTEKEGSFSALSQKGKKLIPLKNPPPDALSASGRGGNGGVMGKDLVFRVRSPLKLYHLAQLYDEYDGRSWHVSKAFKHTSLRDTAGKKLSGHIKLFYTIEKWLSPKLYAPYLALDFEVDMQNNQVLNRNSFFGTEIVSQLPPPPFRYTVNCELNIPESVSGKSAPDPMWQERLPQKFYLRLPCQRISKRVKLLAKRITAGCKTPYEKASALRNFLRSNYRYKLYSDATPPNHESCDYFLFHLQEGHCEYFAAALAVLARLNQLPARVATGFSPGNYNTLTREFEVFEYHAHAWTQIYIPYAGWLTFDATPPASIVSDTTPVGFGKMRDPFGDEWKIRPPELTAHTLKQLKMQLLAEQRKQQGDVSGMEEALNKIAQAGEKIREDMQKQEEKQKKIKTLKPRRPGLIDLDEVKERLLHILKLLQNASLSAVAWLTAKWWRMLAVPAALALFALLLRIGTSLVRRISRKIRLCLLRKRAQSAPPREALRSGCLALLLLLEKHKMGRKNNQELLNYGASLRADLAPHAQALFRAFYRSEYRSQPPTPQEAQAGAEELNILFQLLENPQEAIFSRHIR